ncbi:MAG: [Fe-Fe] hydrogenase large subunit C-terminal domain-containing protein [Bacillota bacterium]|nr:[Fe-Fe] hydrogenase large subunit C-terminal domain-containing protein [Bacillota bacterium]
MGLIAVKKANCKNCYRCLKNCSVKSIRYKDEKVDIIDNQCILCGRCIITCEQKAKSLTNDVEAIKALAIGEERTVVSLAPSFITAYGTENAGRVAAALRSLGFDYIEETSIGARYVTDEYANLIELGEMSNILSSCCPTVNMLVQKYYPDLVSLIAPVLSPMQAHGKLIKENYGMDTRVVFIGPCVSKLDEAKNGGYIDGAITFRQLDDLLNEKNISILKMPSETFDRHSGYSRIYPIENGILYDLKNRDHVGDRYDFISVSGIDNIKQMLADIRSGRLNHSFIEVNACTGGCVGGPMMPEKSTPLYRSKNKVMDYAGDTLEEPEYSPIDISYYYKQAGLITDIPGEETIRKILTQIGKPTKEQELNCGSCGYPTCRDKAIAVYQGKAELYMCMPYMNDISQTLSNVVLGASPNFIVAVDGDMKIKEINASALKLFRVSRTEALKHFLFEYIDTTDFLKVFDEKENIYNKKVSYDNFGVVTDQTIIYVKEHGLAVGVLMDITEKVEAAENMYNLRMESVEMAQKVIDKQMTVAQEIASLLGETTAETKVTLNKLKNLILKDR